MKRSKKQKMNSAERLAKAIEIYIKRRDKQLYKDLIDHTTRQKLSNKVMSLYLEQKAENKAENE